MVLSKNMQKLVAGSSTIRKLFEEGIELAKEVGAENVYDFSLGNPAAPVPEEVKKSIYDILENRSQFCTLLYAKCRLSGSKGESSSKLK